MGFFGTYPREECEKLRTEQTALLEKYNRKLAQYSQTFTDYAKKSAKLQTMIEDYEAAEHNHQMDSVQMALDLKYLKEQQDVFQGELVELSTTKLDEVKQEIQEQKKCMQELLQQQAQMNQILAGLDKKVKGSKSRSLLAVLLGIVDLAGIVLIGLHLMGYIIF